MSRIQKSLTLFRKPLSTLAAFTDRDLGMRMGFSRITVGKNQRRGREKKDNREMGARGGGGGGGWGGVG